MSKNSPKANTPDEVDIIQIFNIVGNAFKKLFKFLGETLSYLFQFLIKILILVKKNIIKLVIPVLIAGGIGVVLDSKKVPTYTSSLIVKPNFNSNVQLYDNISYLNELAISRDTMALSRILKLDIESASQLTSFSIKAVIDDNTKLRFYNNFIKGLDSTKINNQVVDYEKFIENMPETYYANHLIEVSSFKQTFERSIQDAIVVSVDDNDYFNRTKKTISENILLSTEMLKKQLREVDTLRNIYNEMMIAESEKNNVLPQGGTNISFAEKEQTTNELNLFSEARQINKQLLELNQQKSQLENTITVLSNLKPVGQEKLTLKDRYSVRGALLTAAIVLILFLLWEINKYLNKKEKDLFLS